ncbi:hypothetical protein NFI96_017698, partial [Prochilodus magdalenae]
MWRHPCEDFRVSGVQYFSRHKGEVNCCSFSPDCQILLTCSDDGGLYLWRAATGKLLAKAHGHAGPVKCCAFSSDGCFFASASHDRSVGIWRTSTVERVHVLTGELNSYFLIALRPVPILGSRSSSFIHVQLGLTHRLPLAISCSKWPVSPHVGPISHTRSVETVSFSVDGKWLVSGGWDNTAVLWDTQTGLKLRELLGHSAAVQSSAFSTNSQFLATGSWDRSVKVWGIHSDEEVVTLEGHQGNVACLCFSTTGMLASGSWDGTVRVWSPQKQMCLFVLGGGERVWVRCVAFSRDGLVLASTAEGDTVKIWDMANGRCMKSLQKCMCEGHKDSAYGCVFSPSGALLTSGSDQLDLREEDDESEEEQEEEEQENKRFLQ